MPHLRFSGISESQTKAISKALVDDLSQLVECPRDHFTLELLLTRFIFDGESNANAYPIIDMHWFDRGQAVQDKAAAIITHAVKSVLEDQSLDICVRFTALPAECYYENGEHF